MKFRALTLTVEVEVVGDLPGAELVRALVATYPTSEGRADLAYRLERESITRDGETRAVDDPADLAPLFELDLYEQVIARAAPGWLLHASAVAVDGGAIVFAGPTQAGKTTMALALVARGHRLMTEEIVWIGASGEVRGLCRPLHVRAEEYIPAGWTRIAYPLRDPGGGIQQHVLVRPPDDVFEHEPRPLRAIVRLIHGPTRETQLLPLRPAEAFARIWDPTLRPDDGALAVATEVLRDTATYQLSSQTFDDALAALGPLVK